VETSRKERRVEEKRREKSSPPFSSSSHPFEETEALLLLFSPPLPLFSGINRKSPPFSSSPFPPPDENRPKPHLSVKNLTKRRKEEKLLRTALFSSPRGFPRITAFSAPLLSSFSEVSVKFLLFSESLLRLRSHEAKRASSPPLRC